MKQWIYPDLIENLKDSCKKFLKGSLTVQEIQSEIYITEQKIAAIEEKWLRTMLFNAENEIELLIYTVNADQVLDSVNLVVNRVLSNLINYKS